MICADAFAKDHVLSRSLGYMGADIIISPCAWAVPADHDNLKTPYHRHIKWFSAYFREELFLHFDLHLLQMEVRKPQHFFHNQVKRGVIQEAKRWASLPDDDIQWGYVSHTSDFQLYSLTYQVLLELTLTALRNAAEQNRVSMANATLALTMLDEGWSQAEMARRMRISRAAIHQRLEPVRRHLQVALQIEELPAA